MSKDRRAGRQRQSRRSAFDSTAWDTKKRPLWWVTATPPERKDMMEKKTQANAAETASFQKDKYVKEVPDFKMDDNKSEVAIMKDFYTLI